jgi:hypothetical protein
VFYRKVHEFGKRLQIYGKMTCFMEKSSGRGKLSRFLGK